MSSPGEAALVRARTWLLLRMYRLPFFVTSAPAVPDMHSLTLPTDTPSLVGRGWSPVVAASASSAHAIAANEIPSVSTIPSSLTLPTLHILPPRPLLFNARSHNRPQYITNE